MDINHVRGGLNIFFNDKSHAFSFFKKTYTAICEVNVHKRSRPYPPDGFVLTKNYIRSFYTDMIDLIKSNIEKFKPYFTCIPSVAR